jgi:hypothetical protein
MWNAAAVGDELAMDICRKLEVKLRDAAEK